MICIIGCLLMPYIHLGIILCYCVTCLKLPIISYIYSNIFGGYARVLTPCANTVLEHWYHTAVLPQWARCFSNQNLICSTWTCLWLETKQVLLCKFVFEKLFTFVHMWCTAQQRATHQDQWTVVGWAEERDAHTCLWQVCTTWVCLDTCPFCPLIIECVSLPAGGTADTYMYTHGLVEDRDEGVYVAYGTTQHVHLQHLVYHETKHWTLPCCSRADGVLGIVYTCMLEKAFVDDLATTCVH